VPGTIGEDLGPGNDQDLLALPGPHYCTLSPTRIGPPSRISARKPPR
jgi:hypothetical protein